MDKPALLFSTYSAAAAVTATDSYAGTLPADVLNFNEAHFWRPLDATADKILTIDLAAVKTIDHLAMVGTGLDGVVLTLEGSLDNFVTAETIIDAETVTSTVNAAWFPLPLRSWRYLRLTFSLFPSSFRISFISTSQSASLPWLVEDWDADGVSESGQMTISPAGLFLGTVQQRTLRNLPLVFGSVTPEEYAHILRWAQTCQQVRAPYFFVPDISASTVFFGWSENGTFSAPLRNGVREVATVNMITRGA